MPHPHLHHRLTGCLAAATLLALGPGLAGCSPDSANPTDKHGEPSTTTSTAPNTDARSDLPFDSDEEALAAAQDAYGKYLHVIDEIIGESGVRPERIDGVASGDAKSGVYEAAAEAQASKQHSIGDTTFYAASLSGSVDARSSTIKIHVCKSVQNVNVIDEDGNSVVAPDRNPLLPKEITLRRSGHDSLLVDKAESIRMNEETNPCER